MVDNKSKRKLRIGIEVQRLFREKKHGMEVVALELIQQLQLIDKYNDYIVYVRDDKDVCISETANFKLRILSAKTYFTWEQFVLPSAVKDDNLDFLHSTCNTSALNLSVPLLLTVHDIIYLEKMDFKGTAYQNFGNIYRRLIVPRIVRKCKYVITVSHFERNVILNNFEINCDKVKVIYNAVNSRFGRATAEAELKAFRKAHSLPDRFILFLGNTAPKKNTYNVIQAYVHYKSKVLDGLPIVILDYNPLAVYQLLEKFGATHLKNCFIFPGYIKSDMMHLLYRCSALFLYPSLRESFGLPILEAMACNVPVITSKTSSMPEVSKSAALLVDPYNAEEISAAIEEILSDEELGVRLRALGVKRSADFTWRKAADDLLALYNDMV